MSFILDAIRRSEEARRKRLIPDVSTIHTAPPAPARAGGRTLQAALAMGIAVALVVAAGVAVGPWLRLVQEGTFPPPLAALKPPAPVAEGGNAPAPPDEKAPADPAPVAAEPAPAAPPPQETPTPPQATAPPAPTMAPAPAPAPVPAGDAAAEGKRPQRLSSPPPAVEPDAPRREPRPLAPNPEPRSEGGTGTASRQAAPPPSSSELVDATALRDLPPSVQRTLPGIAITLHRYAASAEARMIRVNGRVAHEGDPVGGDLTVAEITRNGVVFVIGGQRFYMDAFQTWQAKSGS